MGPGTNGAITDCMSRNRFGVFAAIKDSTICDFRNGGRCRLTAGLQYAQRHDESDNGGNTLTSPRVDHDSTGRLLDGFLFIRPVEVFDPSQHSPFSLVVRFDHFTPQTDPGSSVPGAANYAGIHAGVQLLRPRRLVRRESEDHAHGGLSESDAHGLPDTNRDQREADPDVVDFLPAFCGEFLGLWSQVTGLWKGRGRQRPGEIAGPFVVFALFGSLTATGRSLRSQRPETSDL